MSIYDQARRYLLKLVRGQRVHGFTFALIGGWAIWHYNPYLESKDIDLVIRREEYWRLKELLRAMGFVKTKGKLAKEGFTIKTPEGNVDIDIYCDKIGPVEVKSIFRDKLLQMTKLDDEEIYVVNPSILLVTKLVAAKDRGLKRQSAKGMKDLTDIFALIQAQSSAIDWGIVREHVGLGDIKTVLAAAFSDYTSIKHHFPALNFGDFGKMRKEMKDKGLI
jgi:hypothetical protein